MITTEAWVLHQGPENAWEPGELVKETFSFPDITEHEVLLEPLFGCWEGNMSHAVGRRPIDICRQRREEKVIIGNSGVMRVLKVGANVTTVQEGDFCTFTAIGTTDPWGYAIKIVGYDAPGTLGIMAKQIKLHENQIIPVPKDTKHSLQQWAAFSLRYPSAWSNWKVAYGCWQVQMPKEMMPEPIVWGWGGGVTLGELLLAKHAGCRVTMIASSDARLALIESLGIQPIDRRQFAHLNYDERKYRADAEYRQQYQEAEKTFLGLVKQQTNGMGVSIFIDNIGGPVFRATAKALGRQGVVATQGWKRGMDISLTRAIECIARHIHVHTHAATYHEAVAAAHFAEEQDWLPPVDEHVWGWDEIPQLAQAFANDKIDTYFPVFQINPV